MKAIRSTVAVTSRLKWFSLAVLIGVLPCRAPATEHVAASEKDVARIDDLIRPGDTLILKDGEWKDQQLIIHVAGTADKPITVRAQTPGKVIFSGTSRVELAGRHIVLSGVYFRDFTGDSPTVEVPGSQCRVTDCAFDRGASKNYVHLVGPENRFDHNYLAGKTSESPTLQVEVPQGEPPHNTRIDHNHFGHREPLGKNGGETMRVGYSHQATNSSRTLVELNLFERCDGENEIISSKSCDNTYRWNTFLDCAGMLTLRHGNRCTVDGNVFIAHHQRGSAGIRVVGEDHVITNNYIEGMEYGGILLVAGPENPQPKDHQQARNCLIAHNTVVDSIGACFHLSVGFNPPKRPLKPDGMTVVNNIFSPAPGKPLFEGDEGAGYRWASNFVPTDAAGRKGHAGIERVDLKLAKAAGDELIRPAADSPVRGAASRELSPQVDHDVDGQARGDKRDAGCDQLSDEPVKHRVLKPQDVGPSWLPREGKPDDAQPGGGDTRGSDNEAAASSGRSTWVHLGPDHHLVYRKTERGDRIMDFSFAGYRGGGVALPNVPVKKKVSPSGKTDADDTADIQAAIDAVSEMPLVDGVRGAVLLAPGTFRCNNSIQIRAAGVVLRGSGSSANGTIVEMNGRPHGCIRVRGPDEPEGPRRSKGVPITDRYVPSGGNTVSVADASSFKKGDDVIVRRPVTSQWVKFMGMDNMTRDGNPQKWVGSDHIPTRRKVVSVDGKHLTFDLPLTDSIDAELVPGATVVKSDPVERISEVGIESLRIAAPSRVTTIEEPNYRAFDMNGVADAWVRDLHIENTVNSVGIGHNAARVTLERITLTHEVATKGSAKPGDFSLNGSQILMNRCTVKGDTVFWVTTAGGIVGPNVVLNCTFNGDGWVQPHMRWATGLLVDSCQAPQGGIDFMNRGSMGSGHGWTIGWAVAWNCTAKTMLIQQPPGAFNWAIGCVGEITGRPQPFLERGQAPDLPRGTFESHGGHVNPKSLYLAQLRERLGAKALAAIGYTEADAK